MDVLVFIVLVAALVFGMNRLTRASRRPVPRPTSLRAAEDDARAWVDRLGACVVPAAAVGGTVVREAHLDALGRYDLARWQLARARTAYEFSLAGRTAIEGLRYVQAMQRAQGHPVVPGVPSTGPDLALAGQVVVAGTTYYASPHPSEAMPYYFPGGSVAGRIVPAAWFGQPWWRSPVAPAAPSLRKDDPVAA